MKEVDFYARQHTDKIVQKMKSGLDFPHAVAMVAIPFFASHGFSVTEKAIIHNVEAWQDDYKSGYLDKENNNFLFSPCGCNPLRLTAMEYTGEHWQCTYIA